MTESGPTTCPAALRAYVRLRDAGSTTITEAIERLAPLGGLTPGTFDVIADGLHLYRLELEDEELLPSLDVHVVEQLCELRDSHRSERLGPDGPLTPSGAPHRVA